MSEPLRTCAARSIHSCPICGTTAALDQQEFYDMDRDTTRRMYWIACEQPHLVCLCGPAADSPEAAIAVWDRICEAVALERAALWEAVEAVERARGMYDLTWRLNVWHVNAWRAEGVHVYVTAHRFADVITALAAAITREGGGT